jgi:hypothetical protein
VHTIKRHPYGINNPDLKIISGSFANFYKPTRLKLSMRFFFCARSRVSTILLKYYTIKVFVKPPILIILTFLANKLKTAKLDHPGAICSSILQQRKLRRNPLTTLPKALIFRPLKHKTRLF